MAKVATAWVDVKPDLSAFRQVGLEEVNDVLVEHLLKFMPRDRNSGDLAVCAAALLNTFTILPK